MLNRAMIIGHLGADPETRLMQDGTCVCNIRVATTERYKDKSGARQEKTEWHRIVLWGKLGEVADRYLHRGSQVYIEGKIETRKWTNTEGVDVYTTEIRANEMKMLGGTGDGASRAPSQDGGRPTQRNQRAQPSNDPFAGYSGHNAHVVDDIPF